MKNRFMLFLLCAVVLLLFNGCSIFNSASNITSNPNTNEFKVYEDRINRTRIKYPANWFLLEKPKEFDGVCFFPANRYKENKVVVTVFDKNSYTKKYGSPEISGEITTLANNPATKKAVVIDYSSDYIDNEFIYFLLEILNAFNNIFSAVEDKFTKKVLQVRMIKNDKIYMITYLTREIYFDDYIDIVNEMIDSFEIY